MNVELEDVTVRLGETTALTRASLSVPSGSFVGLVGPNGAGKTTLLRTINATLAPDEGRVLVAGEDVARLSSRAASRRVATVPQDTSIPFSFSVRRVVEMGRHPHRPRFGADPDPGAVERAMERTGVADLADRSVDAVSGGERQRVLIARALAQDAPVFVLDEPTASLDVNHGVATLDLVAGLVEDGRTALAAIHDLNLAARYCDAVALLSAGQVLEFGPPESVFTEDRIGRAFDADAVVTDHPVTGSPLVTALSGRDRSPAAGPDRSPANDRDRSSATGRNRSSATDGEGPSAADREGPPAADRERSPSGDPGDPAGRVGAADDGSPGPADSPEDGEPRGSHDSPEGGGSPGPADTPASRED